MARFSCPRGHCEALTSHRSASISLNGVKYRSALLASLTPKRVKGNNGWGVNQPGDKGHRTAPLPFSSVGSGPFQPAKNRIMADCLHPPPPPMLLPSSLTHSPTDFLEGERWEKREVCFRPLSAERAKEGGKRERRRESEGGKLQLSVVALYHSLTDPRKWKQRETRGPGMDPGTAV